jgi:hypothetical protein
MAVMGFMEATESLKYPYLITRDTSPLRVVLEVFRFSPSDGCPMLTVKIRQPSHEFTFGVGMTFVSY